MAVSIPAVASTPRFDPAAVPSAPWRLARGATVVEGGVTFRVWAPKRSSVDVVIDDRAIRLEREPGGYFSGLVEHARAGARYRYRLDGGAAFPDPCSRYQPDGPHEASMVVDRFAYEWRDHAWPGIEMAGQVIYELHVGTFTREGTLDAAARELPELARLGVTVVELMPLAEFPGRFNWGYDGVDLYAPCHVYGDPDALRRFVDAAHATGLGVILDVVYNHVGPAGNYLREYSDDYFTDRYDNEWGDAINFDGEGSAPVRELVVENACYWIAEYHVDGLRLDATQSMHDASAVHVLAELSRRTRAVAAPRRIVLIGENEPQDVRCVTPVERGGFGLDAMWSDDFHHTARVALTGRREAYYTDYRGRPQELISAVTRGHLFQGQRYRWQQKRRGTPVTSEPASAFVFYLQNHDQVANHVRGERLPALTGRARYRAMLGVLLLAPETPLLFMGQEFDASSPFLFFADHSDDDLAESIRHGRREFLSQFPSYATPDAQARIPDPCDEATFERVKLDLGERVRHVDAYRLSEDLLRLRRTDPVISRQRRDRVAGAVLGPEAFVLRFSGDGAGDRLLVVNLGVQLEFDPAPEPLLAPVADATWRLVWASSDPRYGGPGLVSPYDDGAWTLPGETAVLLASPE